MAVNGAGIMGTKTRGISGSHKDLSHLAQLILDLLRCNTMNSKTTLPSCRHMEMLSCLVNASDTHKASREGLHCSDFAIDFNEALHTNLDFTPRRLISLFLRKMVRDGQSLNLWRPMDK